jgi:hypothetical protein
MTVADLRPEEYAPFYANYVRQVPADFGPAMALEHSGRQLTDLLRGLDPADHDYAYAPGKWTVRQALQHISDTERIFAYRILRLGRHDPTPLAGFDQDKFAERARVDQRPFAEMIREFVGLRQGTVDLVRSLTENDLCFRGSASGADITTRAMAYITAGHVYHHCAVYRANYVR